MVYCILLLLDGVDELLGRVNFLFDKYNGFLFLFIVVLFCCFFFVGMQYILVLIVYVQVGCILGVEGQFQFFIVVLDNEVWYDILISLVVVVIGKVIGWFRVEFDDFINSSFQVIVGNVQLVQEFIVMFFGKFVKVIVDDFNGQVEVFLFFKVQEIFFVILFGFDFQLYEQVFL